MDGSIHFGAVSAASLSPTSPVSVRSHAGANGAAKRKRSAAGTIDSSPGSVLHDHDDDTLDQHEKKRQPGVKRACNECRQQKLRCDVQQDPFQSCSRCNRLKLECKIESNFKRVGKRSKHAEMEREIEKLRLNVQRAKAQGFMVEDDDDMQSQIQSPIVNSVYSHTRNPSLMGSDEAVTSLLTLKRGGSYNLPRFCRELEGVRITDDAEKALFAEYFLHYHPFLPFLNPIQSPEQYYQQHSLLYWTIISVAARRYAADPTLLESLSQPLSRLLWSTIGEVPGTHFVVKALCLLCTWPLPTSTSTSDPTHILCGVLMKVATGIGLHRPSHINDFTRIAVELNKDQLHDRVVTWAVCNIVGQSIGTGYGQPASTLYDWTLAVRPGESGPFQLSEELEARLEIERFCDKISKEMYSNASDSRGVAGDEHRAILMRVFRREYSELHAAILSRNNVSPIAKLHLKAAGLHLRLAGFFDSSTTPGYMDDLLGLWRTTVAFLDDVIEADKNSALERPGGGILKYVTNYLQQMLVAAGFALLKLMRSFFSRSIDFERGRRLFHETIQAIRATSVVNNDMNWRLAELMVQMWNGARLDSGTQAYHDDDPAAKIDDSLQLKVRSLKHPTNPDSANESSASSTHLDSTLMPPTHGLPASLLSASSGAMTPNGGSGLAGPQNSLFQGLNEFGNPGNYDFFDPQHWMLDNLLDFNYNMIPPLEGA
ncbi:uncharacterized protein E0L32_010153 [Thyridium curvatum]|uniref:Zn(2)-C6 fungal-type domain-containing protein n=1 Tax=Thyridium curvatum TaxID=1093900 RepID=A0A507ALH9_9PEZI|nr:uncharacterized protein E0L32_010153 [Thyridium curvatum]TPX08423.1 hypothetical protein E0L32_010153 [Thyridium curvatum]